METDRLAHCATTEYKDSEGPFLTNLQYCLTMVFLIHLVLAGYNFIDSTFCDIYFMTQLCLFLDYYGTFALARLN